MRYNAVTIRWCRAVCCWLRTMIILVNLLVDLLYGVVNPRIRHKK